MKGLIAVLLINFLLLGCSSTAKNSSQAQTVNQPQPAAQVASCYYFGDGQIAAPDWVCNANTDEDAYYIQATGFSDKDLGGPSHQQSLAILHAKKILADQLKTNIVTAVNYELDMREGIKNEMSQNQQRELNVLAIQGMKVLKSMKGPDGYFYAHVGLPAAMARKNIESIVDITLQDQSDSALKENQGELIDRLAIATEQ